MPNFHKYSWAQPIERPISKIQNAMYVFGVLALVAGMGVMLALGV